VSIRHSFDNFSPLNEEIDTSTPYGFHVEMIAIRARKLLANRTNEQLKESLDTLSWILEEGTKIEERAADEALSDESDRDTYVITSTNALRSYMPLFDIKDQATFPEAQWPEYFALLSLAYIGLALDDSGDEEMKQLVTSIGVDPSTVDTQRENNRLEYLLSAAEAISTAEALHQLQIDKQKIHARGGQRRAAKYAALKTFVIDEWTKKYQQLSNRQAGKKIWKTLPDDLKGLLTTDEPWHRFATWIGQHQRRS